jgi:hypothetical protein
MDDTSTQNSHPFAVPFRLCDDDDSTIGATQVIQPVNG